MVGGLTVSKFDRKLSEAGLAYLETRPAWWQDLLEHRFTDIGGREQPLFLAIRNGYLNAYVEGQSVLKVGFELRTPSTALLGTIHHKYVVGGADGQLYLKFDGSKLGGKPYLGRSSLNEWARQAKTYATSEKQGVAAIAGRNAHVIDVEMGLPAAAIGAEKRPSAPRMDIVALETDGKGIKIVFYEAKLFRNPELRADDLKPRVLNQLQRYEDWINSDHRADEVVNAYRRACGILIRLNATRSEATGRPVHPLVVEAAKEGSDLRVDRRPRLIIFGYKPEQRDAYWKRHECALRSAGIDGGRLIMAPHPEDVSLLEATPGFPSTPAATSSELPPEDKRDHPDFNPDWDDAATNIFHFVEGPEAVEAVGKAKDVKL
jgi:hypothetical protein